MRDAEEDKVIETTITVAEITTRHVPGGTRARIRSMVPSLTSSDARIAAYLLANHARVSEQTVTDIAAAVGSAPSSVVRCCQRMGFKGFHELKLSLARDSGLTAQIVTGDVSDGDPPATVLQKTFTFQSQAITESLATINPAAFEAAVDLFAIARRIMFVGVGTSAPLKQDAAYRFQTIGLRAESTPDVHVQHVTARLLSAGDVCCAISHTGSTYETVNAVRAAKEAGAKTIAITSFAHSPLTEIVDVALVAGSRETAFRLEAMTSRVIHLLVLDSLFIALGLRLGDSARAALDHYNEVIADHRY